MCQRMLLFFNIIFNNVLKYIMTIFYNTNFIRKLFVFIYKVLRIIISLFEKLVMTSNNNITELQKDAGQYFPTNINIINKNEKMINLWCIDDLEYMEKDLDFGEKISLLFLLHGDNNPQLALQKYIISKRSKELHFLSDWARNESNWKNMLLEALCIIQEFRAMAKLGLDLNELKIRFLPHNPETNLYIHPVLKVLYIMCERLPVDKRIDLIVSIQNKFLELPQILDNCSKYLECHLLQWIDHKIIKIGCREQVIPKEELNCDLKHIIKFLKINELDSIKDSLLNVVKYYNNTCNNNIIKDNTSPNHQNSTSSIFNDYVKCKPTTDKSIKEKYNISKHSAGFILIINQLEFYLEKDKKYKHLLPREPYESREGTNIDKESLRNTFEFFGYQTIIYENITHHEILEKIKFTINETHRFNYDSLIVAILSHGDEGFVMGSNSIPLEVKKIRNLLSSKKMLDKPKFLIIQSCQGKRIQRVDLEPDLEYDGGPSSSLYANELVAWSTIPGFASIRDPRRGAWFIQELCARIRESYKHDHLQEILTTVIRNVSAKKDNRLDELCVVLPKQESTLCYKFYLPYED